MDLGLKLKRIHDVMEKNANREVERLDVTFAQHHVLMYLLHHKDEAVSLKELEKHFGVAQSTMASFPDWRTRIWFTASANRRTSGSRKPR